MDFLNILRDLRDNLIPQISQNEQDWIDLNQQYLALEAKVEDLESRIIVLENS